MKKNHRRRPRKVAGAIWGALLVSLFAAGGLDSDTLTFKDGTRLENVVVTMRGETLLARSCDGRVTEYAVPGMHLKRERADCTQHSVQQTLVYNLAPGEVIQPNEGFLAIFANKMRTLLITSRGGKQFVIYNGKTFGPYEMVGTYYHKQTAEQHILSVYRGGESMAIDLSKGREIRLPPGFTPMADRCNYGSFSAYSKYDLNSRTHSVLLSSGQRIDDLVEDPSSSVQCSAGAFTMQAKRSDLSTYRIVAFKERGRDEEGKKEYGPFRWSDESEHEFEYEGKKFFARARNLFVFDLQCDGSGGFTNETWGSGRLNLLSCGEGVTVAPYVSGERYTIEVNGSIVASLTREQVADWQTTFQGKKIRVMGAQRFLLYVAESPNGVDLWPMAQGSNTAYGHGGLFIGLNPGVRVESIRVEVPEPFLREGQSFLWWDDRELPSGARVQNGTVTFPNGHSYPLKLDSMRMPAWILGNAFCLKMSGEEGPQLLCSNEKKYPGAFSPVLSEENGRVVLRYLFLRDRSVFLARVNL